MQRYHSGVIGLQTGKIMLGIKTTFFQSSVNYNSSIVYGKS